MVRARANGHFLDFCIAIDPNYRVNWHLEEIAKELEKIEKGENEYKVLILMMPPRHGKSMTTSINFPAWYLGRNSKKRIITASYSGDLAVEFGGMTRNIFSLNAYKHIFNDVSLKSDEKSKARWLTNKGGSYTSVGIGGATTGRGADIFIIDDPIKNREEGDSEVIRNKHWGWFTSTAYTRLEPGGTVILILTRWHFDDLAGRILGNEELAKLTKVIKFPAIAEFDEVYRKTGEPLWPNRYDLMDLKQIKETIGPYDWASLYQQSPIASALQEFKEVWFRNRDFNEVLRLDTRNFLTIDTAMSKTDSADFTGFCENRVDRQNNWNFRAWRMRLNPKELIDMLFKLYEENGYEKIGIEETVYLDVLKPFLDDEMRKRGKFLPVESLKHNQIRKETRIRGLIPRYASGSVFHITGECRDLQEEQLVFPKGVHDDVLDAAAYQLQLAEENFDDYGGTVIEHTRDNINAGI